MKVIMEPVDMIAWFDVKGIIMPIKFRLETEDHILKTVKIDKVLYHSEEKIAGNPIRTYTCLITVNDAEKHCELKYELNTCKWILFKI